MGTENALQAPHQLQLDSRSRLHMTGVIEVESFDEATIVLTTTRGTLIVRGENLHLQLLRLDGGEVLVDGTVDSLSYEDAAPAGGFFRAAVRLMELPVLFRRSSLRRPCFLADCLASSMIFCVRRGSFFRSSPVFSMRCFCWRFFFRCYSLRSMRGRDSSGCSSFRGFSLVRQDIFSR